MSTISESLCASLDLLVQPLDTLLEVAGVGGQSIPYNGFTTCKLAFPDISQGSFESKLSIVPSTCYNERVPLFIGTNILQKVLLKDAGPDLDCFPGVWKLALGSVRA